MRHYGQIRDFAQAAGVHRPRDVRENLDRGARADPASASRPSQDRVEHDRRHAAYPPAYDGIGLLTFDSVDAALEAFAAPAGQAARQHTATFADSAGALRFFAEALEVE